MNLDFGVVLLEPAQNAGVGVSKTTKEELDVYG
jgi:hypothetical protein